MTITAVQEKDAATLNSATIPYYVRDDTTTLSKADAVAEAIAQSVTDGVGTVTDYQYKKLGDKVARVTLQQRPLQLSPLTPPAIGTVEAGFDFVMGPIERQISIKTVSAFGGDVDDFGGAINVPSGVFQGIAGIGVRLPPPPQVIWRRWTAAASVLTSTYANTVAGLVGTVSSKVFKGIDAGTLCLVRASGTLRDDESASLYFGWAVSANVPGTPGEQWGTHSISYKGFEYPWAHYDHELKGSIGKKFLAANPTRVYVEQILPTADHNALNIP